MQDLGCYLSSYYTYVFSMRYRAWSVSADSKEVIPNEEIGTGLEYDDRRPLESEVTDLIHVELQTAGTVIEVSRSLRRTASVDRPSLRFRLARVVDVSQ